MLHDSATSLPSEFFFTPTPSNSSDSFSPVPRCQMVEHMAVNFWPRFISGWSLGRHRCLECLMFYVLSNRTRATASTLLLNVTSPNNFFVLAFDPQAQFWHGSRSYASKLWDLVGLIYTYKATTRSRSYFLPSERSFPLTNGSRSFSKVPRCQMLLPQTLTIRVLNPLQFGLCFLSFRHKLPTPWSWHSAYSLLNSPM